MNIVQQYLCQMQDVLLEIRCPLILRAQSQPVHQKASFGVLVNNKNLENRATIQRNWSSAQNDLIMQFQVNMSCQSLMVEEWNIRVQANGKPSTMKQACVFMRSFIVLVQLVANKTANSYEFHFNTQNLQKRGDWANPSAIRNHEISSIIDGHHVIVNVAYQCELPEVPRIHQSAKRRSGDTLKKMLVRGSRQKTSETDCNTQMSYKASNSSKQRSFVSLFSKQDDVEILSTPDGADMILEKARGYDDFQIQMIILEEQPQDRERLRQDLIESVQSLRRTIKPSPQGADMAKVINLVLGQQ